MTDNPNKIDKTFKGLVNNFKLMATRHLHPWYTYALVAVVIGFSIGVVYVSKQSELTFIDSQAVRGGTTVVLGIGGYGDDGTDGARLADEGTQAIEDGGGTVDYKWNVGVGYNTVDGTAKKLCRAFKALQEQQAEGTPPINVRVIAHSAGSYVISAMRKNCPSVVGAMSIDMLALDPPSLNIPGFNWLADCCVKIGGLVSGSPACADAEWMCGGEDEFDELENAGIPVEEVPLDPHPVDSDGDGELDQPVKDAIKNHFK